MADFATAVIAHESDVDGPDNSGPVCFKGRTSPVDTVMADNQVILGRCPRSSTDESVSNWKGTFWDLSQGSPSD